MWKESRAARHDFEFDFSEHGMFLFQDTVKFNFCSLEFVLFFLKSLCQLLRRDPVLARHV